MQARLSLKTHMFNLRKQCNLCIDVKKQQRDRAAMKDMELDDSVDDETDSEYLDEDDTKIKGENSKHCHCPLFQVWIN